MGFIYIWRDNSRNMYYIGSHDGTPEDGYLSSSRWLNGEINYRPNDFRRKVLKVIDLSEMKLEEYRIIKKIKESEFGTRYYNLKSGRKKGTPASNKGIPMPEKQRKKISSSRSGQPSNNRINPHGAVSGRKSAVRNSEIATGRKRKYRDDGSWCWEYPIK